jgi:hypothetical protein
MTYSGNRVENSVKIAEDAKAYGIPLRVMGGCAVMIHCPRFKKTLEQLGRTPGDIDLVGLSKDGKKAREFMDRSGFTSSPTTGMRNREEYTMQNKELVELFLDKLELCHDIDLRNRLQYDFPTIPLADLLLQKTQIVKINEKDIQDILVLLLEHDVGSTDQETINMDYIAKTLCEDWGFYYTVTTNLKLSGTFLEKYSAVLSEKERSEVNDKINKLTARIDREPKSFKWKVRERVGTKKIWYREVEERVVDTPMIEAIKAKDDTA